MYECAKTSEHNCPSCGENASYPYLNKENTSKSTVLCGRNTVQIRPPHKDEINFEQYKELLEGRVNDLNINPYLLSFLLKTRG